MFPTKESLKRYEKQEARRQILSRLLSEKKPEYEETIKILENIYWSAK